MFVGIHYSRRYFEAGEFPTNPPTPRRLACYTLIEDTDTLFLNSFSFQPRRGRPLFDNGPSLAAIWVWRLGRVNWRTMFRDIRKIIATIWPFRLIASRIDLHTLIADNDTLILIPFPPILHRGWKLVKTAPSLAAAIAIQRFVFGIRLAHIKSF